MSAIDDGGPAFPRRLPDIKVPPDEAIDVIRRHSGMSLRDYFAAKAMAVLLPNLVEELDEARQLDGRTAAEQTRRGCVAAYKIADAMLKARQA